MPDQITVLKTCDKYLTKVFKADGGVASYEDAKSFFVKSVEVADLSALSELLSGLEGKHDHCIIRGAFVGKDRAEKGAVKGTYLRQNVNFDDQPLHMINIDIDGYKPGFADPVHEPVEAILDFITDHLPACFSGAAFHWQLSSSAGRTPGVLKAHAYFWSSAAYTSAQLYAWAKGVIGTAIDKTFYRRVQVLYTANPVFEEGVTDPVPVRSGFYPGKHPMVDLLISDTVLETARAAGAGEGGQDMKLVDPSQKEGIVGAYHRAYDAPTVLMEHLEGMFEPGSTDRRWTWLNGGGTPEGVWVHDDGMHVHAVHNTWPCPGIVNLWDLVRVLKFGELDRSDDEFEQLDLDSLPIQARPSNIAMLEWAGELEEVKAQVSEDRAAVVSPWLAKIGEAADMFQLEHTVIPQIQKADGFSVGERSQLAEAIKARYKAFGSAVSISDIRRLIKPTVTVAEGNAPDWAKYWVWVAEEDGFMNIETKQVISERSYNAKYDRFMAPYADENGSVPRASEQALTVWRVKAVDRAIYLPTAEDIFTMDGMTVVNTYRRDLAPQPPDQLTEADIEAVRIVEEHTEMLIPDKRERSLFLDFLAYCVQNPGRKIRWAVFLKGVEGDGKSAYATLMRYVLGHSNVKVIDGSTLEHSSFSGWATDACLAAVEEVKLHGHNRYDVYNKLKPYISNDFIEVHPKGKDPYNAPNCMNQLLFSNFDDGVPITDNDRRLMVLRAPFVTKEEVFAAIKTRTGLDATEYYDRLFDQAIKAHPAGLHRWLIDRELSPEFKPDGRAPITKDRAVVVALSRRDDEVEVESLIEEQGLGVYKQLISTRHLSQLARDRFGTELRTSRISSILMGLGYQSYSRQLKWRGYPVRVYTTRDYPTDTAPASVAADLELMEKKREEELLDRDFAD